MADGETLSMVKAIRAAIPATHEWDEREQAMFRLAEAQAADIDALEADIAEHGVRSPSGRLNTIVSEARQARLALSRILNAIDVPEAERPSVLHARRAAQARWGGAARDRDREAG